MRVGPLKKKTHERGGDGGGAGIIMSSNDVGSYEFKRSSCEMHMEESGGRISCEMQMSSSSERLPRTTSDGSADSYYYYYYHYYCYYCNYYPPTHRWSCVVDAYLLNSYHLSSDPTSNHTPLNSPSPHAREGLSLTDQPGVTTWVEGRPPQNPPDS